MFRLKISEQDCNVNMLPHTRRQVWFDVFKLHWGKFLALGLAVLIFLLPSLINTIICELRVAAIMGSYSPSMTSEQRQALMLSVVNTNNLHALIGVPLTVIFFIGLAGLIRIIRQYCWLENVYFKTDFLVGIKQNGRQYILYGLIIGMMQFLCTVLNNIISTYVPGTAAPYIAAIPSILCLAVFGCPFAYAITASSIYSNTFKQNIKNGYYLYAKHIFKSLGVAILCVAVFIPQTVLKILMLSLTAQIVLMMFTAIITPFILLGWYLFCLNAFDEYINPQFHPELVGKGTFTIDPGQPRPLSKREQKTKRKEEELM